MSAQGSVRICGHGAISTPPPYSITDPLAQLEEDDSFSVSSISSASSTASLIPPDPDPVHGSIAHQEPLPSANEGRSALQLLRAVICRPSTSSPIGMLQRQARRMQQNSSSRGVNRDDQMLGARNTVCDICGSDCGITHSRLNEPLDVYTPSQSDNAHRPVSQQQATNIEIDPDPAFDYGLSSLHFPKAYQSNGEFSTAPWCASFQIRIPHPVVLVEPFDWRQYASNCYRDEITQQPDGRRRSEDIFRRELSWEYHVQHGDEYVPDRDICIRLYSKDLDWLVNLSRQDVMDLISMGSAVRVTGWEFMPDNPDCSWGLAFIDYPNPWHCIMSDRQGDALDIDDPELRLFMFQHYESHILHPDEA